MANSHNRLDLFDGIPRRDLDLLEALDMVLAEDLVAPFNVPPLANSAMDGYAVVSSDLAEASESSQTML